MAAGAYLCGCKVSQGVGAVAMGAVVGLLSVDVDVADALTLKDKRQVVRSLIGRIEHRYNVSVAEVGGLDSRRTAEIAVACVANAEAHVQRVLNEIVRYMESDPRADIVSVAIEIL